jgi:hypothetical protein
MYIEKVLELFGNYIDDNKLGGFPSLQIHRDGSGSILDTTNCRIRGTEFNNVQQLIERLTAPSELKKTQQAYAKALGKHYLPGSKIILQVINEDLVEVTVRPA